MRLLGSLTSTPVLYEFFGDNIPPYCILSHTWGGDEVTFQDFQSRNVAEMAGYSKIKQCCAQAVLDGYQYVWIDTCCIDKSSSAELSEAINSMFQWYQDAHVCYTYLSDVPSGGTFENFDLAHSAFRRSRWFTRGWTLQELIAPDIVVFFDRGWVEIGTRSSLRDLISSITGIQDVDDVDISGSSIAQKMSWASRRNTTRLEDQAYCLLGICGVNMPLLYGEGENAFTRLQEQILQVSDDESIFAWTAPPSGSHGLGILASSPAQFKNSGDIVRFPFDGERPPYVMTNRGLRMEVLLYPSPLYPSFTVPLNCKRGDSIVGIKLGREITSGKFFRMSPPVVVLDPAELVEDKRGQKRERTLLYVKEVKGRASRMFQTVSLTVKLHGVQDNWFLGYRFDNWYEATKEKGNIADDSEFKIGRNPEEIQNLYFEGQSESFVVELKIVKQRARANIFIFEKNQFFDKNAPLRKDQFFEKTMSEYPHRLAHQCGLLKYDRISRRLPSGKHVALTVKRMPRPGRQYCVNITIKPESSTQ